MILMVFQDVDQLTDRIELKGIKAMKEWYQGYEELEAIPHSFAIEFRDGQGSWAMFADSAEEKVSLTFHIIHTLTRGPTKIKLLGLLYQTSGLQV